MSNRPAEVTAALASLEARWGAAAPRRLADRGRGAHPGAPTDGALALVPALPPASDEASIPSLGDLTRVVSTGFPELDAILGPGGLPRNAGVALHGDGSSGRTTLALRIAAEAQAAGSVVAWVDLTRSFDPVEAVARGIRLEWLVVVTPETLDEGLAIAGALLTGRSVDVLVLDMPGRPDPTARSARVADRLHRLAAVARRADTLLLLLDATGSSAGIATAVAESTGLRLELVRTGWIRLGRDVVGQRTEAVVARNRFGPPGRQATLRILYADGGERDACLRRDGLLLDPDAPAIPAPTPADPIQVHAPATLERTHPDAIAPPVLAASAPRAQQGPGLRVLPDRPGRPRRSALVGRNGGRRQPGGAGARRAAGDAARQRTSARTGGHLRRSGS